MLSLLDILFPDATMNLVKKLSPMKTIQPSINLWDTPQKYNGWADWTTWNCALWINNEESIYNIAKDCNDIHRLSFLKCKQCVDFIQPLMVRTMGKQTYEEMNELIQEIQFPIDW